MPDSLPRFVFITKKVSSLGTRGEIPEARRSWQAWWRMKKKEKKKGRKREFQRRFGDVIKNTGPFVVARIPTKLD